MDKAMKSLNYKLKRTSDYKSNGTFSRGSKKALSYRSMEVLNYKSKGSFCYRLKEALNYNSNGTISYQSKKALSQQSKVVGFKPYRGAAMAGLIIMLSACSGMRNVEKNLQTSTFSSDSSVFIKQVESLRQEKRVRHFTLVSDSVNNNYRVDIWPKGKFSYNAERGFEGTAEKILISGNLRQAKHALTRINSTEKTDLRFKNNLETQKKTIEVKKATSLKTNVSWKTILGFVLVFCCLIASVIFYRLLKKAIVY
jgi:hypothetical protein